MHYIRTGQNFLGYGDSRTSAHQSKHASPIRASVGLALSGLYLFFIFFALTMLLLQLVIAVIKLWITGHGPKFLLVAQAHAVPISTILQRLCARK